MGASATVGGRWPRAAAARATARVAALCAILAAAGAPLGAQQPVLRVRLVDSLSRQPLAGVLVEARGIADAPGRSTLTSPDGVAALPLGGDGPWRVVVRRIGYTPFASAPMRPVAGSAPVDVLVDAQRVLLPAVQVTARRACDARAESPSGAAAPLWDDVLKALEASAITRNLRLVTTEGVAFQRQLALDGRTVSVDTFVRSRSNERPFPAANPVELERGYVHGSYFTSLDFYAPDEQALLSPGFTRMHCVSLNGAVRREGDETLVGLDFTPRNTTRNPEIDGTIWVDSATSELRRVEFTYMNLQLPVRTTGLGGEVAFTRAASGAWIIAGWRMRLPHWHQSNLERGGLRLDGYTEIAGTARIVREAAALPASVPRTIRGVAYDSLNGRPFVGLRVTLPSLHRDMVTDDRGAFQFEDVGSGVLALTAEYPGVGNWAALAMRASANTVGSAVADVRLATPSFSTVWKAVCGAGRAPSTAPGIVAGRVVTGFNARPDTAAMVEASWGADSASRQTVRARVDRDGRFAACGLPVGVSVVMRATSDSISSTPFALRLGEPPLAVRTVSLANEAALDLIAEGNGGAAPGGTVRGIVAGRVTDTGGRPVGGARVTLDGSASLEARTDDNGTFVFRGVGEGRQLARAQLIGFEPGRRLLDVYGGDSTIATFQLTRMSVLAAAVVRERARAAALTMEIDQRARLGLGVFTDSLKLARMTSTAQAFAGANMHVVQGSRGNWVVQFRDETTMDPANQLWCTPSLYIDEQRADYDQLEGLRQDRIALIETYRPAARAPIKYAGSGGPGGSGRGSGACGVILVWTKSFLDVHNRS